MQALALTSKGGTLSYAMIGDALVAYVNVAGGAGIDWGDRPVFSLTLDHATGAFTYQQFDQLDHVTGNGENTALKSGSGSIAAIDFGAVIQATDGDGDHVGLGGKFSITITDDVPEIAIFTDETVTIDETSGFQNDDSGAGSIGSLFAGVGNRGVDADLGGPIYARDDVIDISVKNGADDNVSTALTLRIDGGNGINSGLMTTDGAHIYLYLEGEVVVGRVGGADGLAAFAIAIDGDGRVSVAEYLSLKHPNNASSDEGVNLSGKISAVLTATDYDGDVVTKSASIGNKIAFDDDGPLASGMKVSFTADEDDISNLLSSGNHPGDGTADGSTSTPSWIGGGDAATVSGSIASVVSFGADGAAAGGGFGFVADATAKMQALALTSKGGTLSYAMIGDALVAYVNVAGGAGIDWGDRPVFSLTLDHATGAFTYQQFDQLDHVTGNGENTALKSGSGSIAAIDFGAVIQATDGDGDHVGLGGKFSITITDDVPEIAIFTDETVTIDETSGFQNDDSGAGSIGSLFAGVGNRGVDADLGGPIYARDDVIDISVKGGADDNVSTALTLRVDGGNGIDSGLMTTGGGHIYLYLEGEVVVGRVGGANGLAAFAIAIDDDGRVSVAEYLSLKHPSNASSDEGVNLLGKISAVLTATDYDGDVVTKSVSIGDKIAFDDDGPSVGANSAVWVDDDNVVGANGNAGGTGDQALANTAGVLSHDFGADGGAIAWKTTGAPIGFSYVHDGDALLVKQGLTTVMTIMLDTATGAYTVTQNAAIDHPVGNNENEVSFNLTYTVTDGDGDHVDGTLTINADDDTPVSTGVVGTGAITESAAGGSITGELSALVSPGADGIERYSVETTGLSSSLTSLTSDGVALTYSVVGNAVVAKAGTTTIFTFSVDPATGHYSFAQTGPLDHTDSVVIGGVSIPAAALGAVGSHAAVPDIGGNDLAFEGRMPDNDVIIRVSNSGNSAVTWTLNNNNPGGTDYVLNIPAHTTWYVNVGNVPNQTKFDLVGDGSSQNTTVNNGHSITFVDGDGSLALDLSSAVTVTDGDGDSVALHDQLIVTVTDSVPTAGPNAIGTVEEGGTETITAALTGLNWGADAGSARRLSFTGSVATKDQNGASVTTLSSNGNPVTIAVIGGVLTGFTGSANPPALDHIVFTALLNAATGGYTFSLLQPLDHTAPNATSQYLDLALGFTATDADGDAASSTITVRVDAAGSIDSINYSSLSTSVFVNLDAAAHTVLGQTVAGDRATDGSLVTDKIIGIDNVTGINDAMGGSAADVLIGGDEANKLIGNGGSDYLDGVLGADILDGGEGNDTFVLGADVTGSGTRDIQLGDGSLLAVSIAGLAGTADKVIGGTGIDTIVLERDGKSGFVADYSTAPGYLSGVEKIVGTDGNDVILLAAGSTADGGPITIEGGEGNDTLGGSNSADIINGGTGNDLISGLGGNDLLKGGAGNDEIWGGAGDDTIDGGDNTDNITGGLGNDAINGGAGGDTFNYTVGDGIDTINDDSGMDLLIANGSANVEQSVVSATATGFTVDVDGDGTVDVTTSNVESVILNQMGGADKITLRALDNAETITIEGNANLLQIHGSGLPSISGISTSEVKIEANGGNDVINASALDASVSLTVDGGEGDDTITGSAGADTIFGGKGNDAIIYKVGSGADVIDGGTETGSIFPNYDVLKIDGDAESRTFTIGKSTLVDPQNVAPADDRPDVLVTYSGTGGTTVRADEIEGIEITLHAGGGTINVGDLSGTAIEPSTIVINGGAGDDTINLTNLAGTKVVVTDEDDTTGGDIDTMILAGKWADYNIVRATDGTFTFSRGGTVVATAKNIEQFTFMGENNGNGGTVQAIELVNDAPHATADTNAGDPVIEAGGIANGTAGDASATGNVLANDTDADIFDTKTVTSVRFSGGAATAVPGNNGDVMVAGTYGTLTIHADGSYAYALDNNDADTQALAQNAGVNEVFTYDMKDAHGLTSTASLTIAITGTNDATVVDLNGAAAGNGAATNATEQTPQQFAWQASLADVDSSTLQSMTVTLANNLDGASETLFLNATATAAAVGLTVGYNSATGVLSITGSASIATYETILKNIVYQDNSDNPDTSIDRTLTVVVNDGVSDSTPQVATIHMIAINDAPVLAGTLTAVVAEGGSHVLTFAELGYTDPDDVDGGVVFQVSNVLHGVITNGGAPATSFTAAELKAGLISYTHDGSEGPTASFSVKAEDGNEDNSAPGTGTFNFTVTPVNDAPVAVNDYFSTNEDTARSGMLLFANDSDIEGNPLTANGITVGGQLGGSISFEQNGTLRFEPLANESGYAILQYGVSDGNLTSTGTVTIDVRPIADTTTISGSGLGSEDATAALSLTIALGDTDGSEKVTRVELSGFPAGATFNQGALEGGVWVISSAAGVNTSGLTMTPPANYAGNFNLSVSATVLDSATLSDLAVHTDTKVSTGSIGVSITPVNDGQATISVTDLTQTATDPKVGDVLRATLGSDPDGTASNVVHTWLRDGNDTGVTTADYTLTAADVGHQMSVRTTYVDGQNFNETVTSTATAAVITNNHAPVAVNDTLSFGGGATPAPSGTGWSLNAENGHYYKVVAGNYSWTQAAAAAAADGGYLATITSQSEQNFIQSAGTLGTNWYVAQNAWIGGSDSATEGTWKWVSGPESGTTFWSGASNGTASGYENWSTGEPNNWGTGEDHAQMLFVAGGVWNDGANTTAPSGQFGDYVGYVVEVGGATGNGGISEDVTKTFAATLLTANDTDADGDTLTVTSVTNSAAGAIVTLNGDGTISYNASSSATLQALHAGDVRTDTFTYTISDGHGGTSTATATITINGVNDAAVISGVSAGAVTEATSANAGTPTVTGDLNSTDVDGTNDAWTAVTTATASTNGYGTYTMDATGHWSYTVDNTKATVNSLNNGGTLTDKFTVMTADGTPKEVLITINGATDPALPANATPVNAGNGNNNSSANDAYDLSGFTYIKSSDPDVSNAATSPSISVSATGTNFQTDYYKLVVAANNTAVVFDIDNANFDSVIRLTKSGGGFNAILSDDDAAPGETGGNHSYISTVLSAGTYFLQVGVYDGGLGTFYNWTGKSYELQVSVKAAGQDPIILDLDHNGFTFTSVEDGVKFDIDADGHKDQVAWTKTDGILAFDVDGNGKIDNGSEIFTPNFAGGAHAGGVAALSTLDVNHDGKIDASDTGFDKLLVWQDANGNGVSDEGELKGLNDYGITGISLDADSAEGYIDGQSLFAEGSFTYADGSTGSFVEVGFDTLFSDAPDHVLVGTDGDDILAAMPGLTQMTGGAGADTFVLDPSALHELDMADIITDYKSSDGDAVDVSKLLDTLLGHQATGEEAAANVRTTIAGNDTTVSVQVATDSWKDVAVLQNHTEAVKILFDDDKHSANISHV
ncbi:DUF5801 repeats-in-toxin domain-containing protein [Neorhizobium sp. IRAMC:178]|uniref:DUF5801 repeats-in-toxin domain-containing protein n=1 Tax=Neorhizobium tunisiense TaxID=3144793 RepID=UPI0031F669B0